MAAALSAGLAGGAAALLAPAAPWGTALAIALGAAVAACLAASVRGAARARRLGTELTETAARLHAEVAAHRQATQEILSLQRQTEFVLGATKTGLDIIDGQFSLRYVDPAWATHYGDPAGRKCYEYFMGRDEPCPGCAIPRALETRSTIVSEETLARENNRRIQVTTIPFQDDTGEWLVAEVNVDITEQARRAAELDTARQALVQTVEDLERAHLAAKTANRAKSEFLANVSHEIRTPLNGILGFARLLLREALTEDQRSYVETIRRSGAELLELINNILDLSKIEAQRAEAHVEIADVAAIARAAAELLQPRAAEKGLRLTVEVDPRTPLAVATDPTRLRQVLVNLVGNAIKFTHDGSIAVTVGPADSGGDRLLFTVADTGIGIAPGKLAAIFEPFAQGDGSTSRHYGGTGLGLAISKRLVELLGGQLWAEGAPGKGSTFRFTIHTELGEKPPRESGASNPGPAGERGEGRGARAGKGPGTSSDTLPRPFSAAPPDDAPLVLVVEDDPTTARLVTALLGKAGYRCAVARDGAAALDAARRAPPLAVLLDLMLPVMSGFEVLRRLKADPALANVPVIVCSVLPEQHKAFGLGALDYIEKPIDGERLVRKLDWLRSAFGGTGNVLVVDDDRATLLLLRRALARAGYRVTAAASGAECLAIVDARQAVDLVILDLTMPQLDGFDVLDALRRRDATRDVPVLIHTARDLSPDDLARLNHRYDAILHKAAANVPDVLARVAALLASVRRGGRPRHAEPPLRPALILVADDDPVNQLFLQRLLEKAGHHVVLATDGQSAIETVAAQPVDLVLMNIEMPRLGGIEATRRLRATPAGARLPIVALTAHSMVGDEERCLAAGCNTYLSKPADPDRLLEAIARHVAARGTPTPPSQPARPAPAPLPAEAPHA